MSDKRPMTDQEIVTTIELTISDLAVDFLLYDRKEDEELPVGAIEKAVAGGLITRERIIELFAEALGDLAPEEEADDR